jgi:hypothetical protein
MLKPAECGGGKDGFSTLSFQREGGPADSFTSEFWPPELGEINFYYFKTLNF